MDPPEPEYKVQGWGRNRGEGGGRHLGDQGISPSNSFLTVIYDHVTEGHTRSSLSSTHSSAQPAGQSAAGTAGPWLRVTQLTSGHRRAAPRPGDPRKQTPALPP